MRRMDDPQTADETTYLVDALGLYVDALCNKGQTREARTSAEQTIEQTEVLAPLRQGRVLVRVKGPRTLHALRASRILAQAIELDGDPTEAISRLLGFNIRLRQNPELGDPMVIAVERLLVLRALLSAAKRDGDLHAHRFAARARVEGDQLAAKIVHINPDVVSRYYHRAACERRTRDTSRSAACEAADLFERSLPLRAPWFRNKMTHGLAAGDVHVLRGNHAEGAALMTATVLKLEPLLPRHHGSALSEIVDRGLLRVA